MYDESFFDASSSCGSAWLSSQPLYFWDLAEACSLFLFAACTRNGARWQVSVFALAIVQAWMVASAIAKARTLHGNVRNACYRGAQAKFRAVSLVGLCATVAVLHMAWSGAPSGAQGRFAAVILGGVVFSTIAALTVLPVLIARFAE